MIHYLIMSEKQEQIQIELQKYVDYLTVRSLRLSKGRACVFNTVMQTHGHFTAEEIAGLCSTEVSRATVYRSIKEFMEAGVIRETAFGHKHQHYEHVYDEHPHHHFLCMRCHKHFELPDLGEDQVYQPKLKRDGFHVIGHEMHFYGHCKVCKDDELVALQVVNA